jgi:hypothetical protein
MKVGYVCVGGNITSSPSCDRPFQADYAVRGCVERRGGLSGSRLQLLKALMHASISFNSLLRVPGIRVCLRCGIRQEVNFLDDIPQSGKTVVLPQWQFTVTSRCKSS